MVIGLDEPAQVLEGRRVRGPALHLHLGHGFDEGQVGQAEHSAGHVAESNDAEADHLRHGRVLAHSGPQLGELGVDLVYRLAGHGLGNVQAEVEGEDGIAFFGTEVLARHRPTEATGGPLRRQRRHSPG